MFKTSDLVAGLEMAAFTVALYWLAWWAVKDLYTFKVIWWTLSSS